MSTTVLTGEAKARDGVAQMRRMGADPRPYAGSIARQCGISRDAVLAIIAESDEGAIIRDQMTESAAADRLAAESKARKADPVAARHWDHEED